MIIITNWILEWKSWRYRRNFLSKSIFTKMANVRVSVDSAFDKGQFGPGVYQDEKCDMYVAVMYVDWVLTYCIVVGLFELAKLRAWPTEILLWPFWKNSKVNTYSLISMRLIYYLDTWAIIWHGIVPLFMKIYSIWEQNCSETTIIKTILRSNAAFLCKSS